MRSARISVLLALPMLAWGCSNDTPVEITEVYGSAESQELEVGVSSCDPTPNVGVQETADHIEIYVINPSLTSDAECARSFVVQLSTPLSGREVRDRDTGELITVQPPD